MRKRIRSNQSQAPSRNGAGAAPPMDRAAFQETVSAHYQELLAAARREWTHRVELGDFGPHELTPEELVDEALLRAWHSRHSRLSHISIRAWLLAMLFRSAEDAARREARRDTFAASTLQEPQTDGLAYDDDESFWDWYQPEEITSRRPGRKGRTATAARLTTALVEGMAPALGTNAYHAFLLHEIYRLPLRAVTHALGVTPKEAEDLLAHARRYAQAVAGPGA